ncbi:hypothetical protein CTI12_AA112760 [Artemisia annua]|uniref:Protein FAR1-RELATED SEQUENCE n=1 Tax=Artemisia annua TaxID=35608 RepID=A0A2U1PU19_ARTAN|nr:hypothetical protein CTI12_AA112760 [Artemisia annua]
MDVNAVPDGPKSEPEEPIEFDSNDLAYEYYKEYAKSVGFGTAKLSSRRSRSSKEFIDAKFSCIRYGNKQQSNDAINPRPSPKIGCKASMHVKRKSDGKWYIHSFVKEHNHELIPSQSHFFRSHRGSDPHKADAKARRKTILASMSKQYGVYQCNGLDNFIRNQNDRGRSLTLEEGDAQLLEHFVTMQEENPNRAPNVILSDQGNYLEAAIASVFPDTRHCYCLWYVLEKFSSQLDYMNPWHDTFIAKFDKCIHKSWTEEQFDKRWMKLVNKFNLGEDTWFQSLYQDRRLWAPTFIKNVSLAGLSTRSRSESLNSFFDKYIQVDTSLRVFLERYKVIVEDMYEEQAKADFDAWHDTPEVKSPSPFEKQLSSVYTHVIFKKFQVEVLGAAACHLKIEKEDSSSITYVVKDFETNQDYMVEWNETQLDICCSCRSFEFKGYLCRHAIVVLQMSGVFTIPVKYVLQRWTNVAASRIPLSEKLENVQTKIRRLNDLCRRAIIVGEEGSISQESYKIALDAIKDAMMQCSNVNNSAEKEEEQVVIGVPVEPMPHLNVNKGVNKAASGKEKSNNDGIAVTKDKKRKL